MHTLRSAPDIALSTGSAIPLCQSCACRSHCLLGRAPWEVQRACGLVERRFRKGERLTLEGRAVPVLQIVKIGTVLLHRRGTDGQDLPVGMAGCGQALGTTPLFAAPMALSATAVADGRLCEMPAAALTAGHGGPALTGLLHALSQEHARAQAQLADWSRLLRVRRATARLAGALLLLADLQRSSLVRLPTQALLASLLATTHETVARGLAHIERAGGLARQDRWHCAIARPRLAGLARGAETPVSAAQAMAMHPAPAARTTGLAAALAQPSFSNACTSAASACAPLP
ncbi:Crp/Fnr family transcriptional regulator [Acidovorax sp. SUPP3334]|uniref:Crp/Fnr family transcriptional regulator n=1 Tax=Acidovorax sp. SUPP3334 TaxID=2920881 RepID=UPI0023DE3BA9|nr:Crp/Fnr family transcriptional regulator [Acidovorax sp. SUPP3334]GKT21800.1 Crp/Fnr family transcriptional regulator [Acidovorax sp. SUPP3334]